MPLEELQKDEKGRFAKKSYKTKTIRVPEKIKALGPAEITRRCEMIDKMNLLLKSWETREKQYKKLNDEASYLAIHGCRTDLMSLLLNVDE
ncbi:MAG: hypothetical protein ACE5OZ_23225 [Candidatus Heimdallarchaeota archaeon]